MYLRVFLAAFAMFSMYFGSGNIVFPLMLGVDVQSHYIAATFGWALSAIFVPLAGMVAIVRFNCNPYAYFSYLPNIVTTGLLLFFLALIGPFGVIPRCVGLSLGAVQNIFPNCIDWLFNLIYCTAMVLIVYRPDQVMDLLARIITPFKLGSIAMLLMVGLYCTTQVPMGDGSVINAAGAVKKGLLYGYNTMDLLGSFFFSNVVVDYLRRGWTKKTKFTVHEQIRFMSYTSVIAGILLLILYFSIVYLSATFSDQLIGVAPQRLLSTLAGILFGTWGFVVTALIITVTCLSTASVLLLGWSNFMHKQLLGQYFPSLKVTHHQIVLVSAVISFLISLIGFEQILVILGSILEYIYIFIIIEMLLSFFRKVPEEPMQLLKR